MNQQYNTMQTVKRAFFAMRNGIIADTLRKAGSPFKIIFGLNIPQIAGIASRTGCDAGLARELWHNTTTRESMLLAPMVMPRDGIDLGEAMEWAAEVRTEEVADILCHRLLRHTPYAMELADRLIATGTGLARYTGLRLMCNLAAAMPEKAARTGLDELATGNPATRAVASLLAQYAEE